MSDTRPDLNVLFVDDEPRVLEGIERMMFDVADDWIIDTAGSGAEALAKLAETDYAIVVSDMRMPGMDGATLLARIAKEHPGVVRVILSGQTDEAAMLRAVGVAHRLLAKPCDAEALYEVVHRTERLVSKLKDPALRARIAELGELPSPPAVYLALVEALNDPDVQIDLLVSIIGQDPALCARVLQLANSAFFSRISSPVLQVRQAIARVGMRLLRSLALSTGIFRAITDPTALAAAERTQKHAFETAQLALELAGASPQRDDAFTAGLLNDIGFAALAAMTPSQMRAIDGTVEEQLDRERAAFGATHAEIGAHLLDLWGLPLSIVEAVHGHHTPEAIPTTHAIVAAASCLADALAHGEEPSPALTAAYGLGPIVARLRNGERRPC
jgi:HD-like signal output (HDOD) protein